MKNILKEMAERSPKSYAAKIRRRNQKLLDALNRGECYEGHVGCPHCNPTFNCSKCLWSKVTDAHDIFACCRIPFNGINYSRILAFVGLLEYGYDDERIYHVTDTEDRKILHKFLQGHIDWTNKYQWGKKYKRGSRKP